MKRLSVVLLAFLTVPALAAEREVDLLADDADATLYVIADEAEDASFETADLGLPDVSHVDFDGDDAFEFETDFEAEAEVEAEADLLADDDVDLLADE